ncbi:MFS transporter [Streptomyces sp. NPDC048506]|uniref:MFS transporter n=1 Tax=Streptomyces sp. NPDC048506 TaxID=3155028 RepID=UPI003414172C
MPTSLRVGRWATFVFFGLNGFVMGMWVVHIPVIESRVGIGHAVLGWLLLLLGAGAFAGMRLAGPLADRFGPRVAVPAGAALCSAALVLPGLATGPWTLGGALLALGFGNGCLDVAMNAHAVHVERGYRRPIMSAFHAVFSIGGALAALVGARTLGWGWSPAATLGAVGAIGLATGLLTAPALLRTERSDGDRAATATTGRRTRIPARIRALAALALMLMLCEGVANDWSTLHLRDALDAPAATAAIAYGAFATAMTVGRLLTDRVAGRFGAVAVLRYGAATAAVGLAAAALSPWIPLALVGWAVFGIGLSGCIPQLFSAAGHADPEAAATNVSRVAGLGYLGMLAGPAVIGPLTHLAPLAVVLLLPVALCALAAAAAGILRQGPHVASGSAAAGAEPARQP